MERLQEELVSTERRYLAARAVHIEDAWSRKWGERMQSRDWALNVQPIEEKIRSLKARIKIEEELP